MPDELDSLLGTLKPKPPLAGGDDLDALLAGMRNTPVDVSGGLPLPGIPKPAVQMKEQGIAETLAAVPKQAYKAWEQDYGARVNTMGGHPASRPLAPLTKIPFMPTPAPGKGVEFRSVEELRANNPKDIPTAAVSGLAKTVEGLATPENAVIMSAMAVAPPIVAAIANGYFTAEMLKGMVQQSPEVAKAAQEGRWADVAELGTQMAATGAMLSQTGPKLVKDARTAARPITDRMEFSAETRRIEKAPPVTPPVDLKAGVQYTPPSKPLAPSFPLPRLAEKATGRPQPTENRAAMDSRAPETVEQMYARLFDEAGRRNDRPVVPQTGTPMEVQRAMGERERLSQKLVGKPWGELANPERIAIDDLIAETKNASTQRTQPEPIAPEPLAARPAPVARPPQARPLETTPVAAPVESVRPEGRGEVIQQSSAASPRASLFDSLQRGEGEVIAGKAVDPSGTPLPQEVGTLRKANPQLSKEQFDAEVIRLADEGKVYLTRVDSVHEGNVDSLVRDPQKPDTYYVAATLREAPSVEAPAMPKPAVPQARPIVAMPGERGAIGTVPKSDMDLYVERKVQKRDAALQGPGRSWLTSPIRKAGDALLNLYVEGKKKTVDSVSPIEDAIESSQKTFGYKIRPSIEKREVSAEMGKALGLKPTPEGKYFERERNNFGDAVDRAKRHEQIMRATIKDTGFDELVRQVKPREELFAQYLIAKHAESLKEQGDLGTFTFESTGKEVPLKRKQVNTGRTPETIDATTGKVYTDADLLRDAAPEMEPFAQKYREVVKKVNDMAVDFGLFSREGMDFLEALYPHHTPLIRAFAERDTPNGLFSAPRGVAGLSKQHVVEKFKEGADLETKNPLGSLVLKMDTVLKEGLKNKAALVLKSYEDLPGLDQLINPKNRIRSEATATIPYYENGRRGEIRTTPDFADAAKSLNVENLGRLARTVNTYYRFWKDMTTGINPRFLLRNPFRDQGQTLVVSEHPWKTTALNPKLLAESIWDIATRDKMYHDMLRQGAGGTSWDLVREKPMLTVDEIASGKTLGTKLAYHGNPKRWRQDVEAVSGGSEELTRMMQYHGTKDALLGEGRLQMDAEILAAEAARFNTGNFSRGGEWRSLINMFGPYIPASIQGSRAFVRAMARDPKGTAAKLTPKLLMSSPGALFKVSYRIGLPVVAATLWNLSDEERAKKYWDIRRHVKDDEIFLIPPDAKQDERGRYIMEWNGIPTSVPLPPGIKELVIPMRRYVEEKFGGDPLAFREIATAFLSAVSPVEPTTSGTLGNAVPQVLKPTAETALANKDFYRDAPIVTDWMEKVRPEKRRHPWTSATAGLVSKAVNKTGLETAPVQVEHWMKGMLGGAGGMALNLSDQALRMTGAIPKEQVGGSDPFEHATSTFTRAQGGEVRAQQLKKQKELRTKMQEAADSGNEAGVRKFADELKKQGMESADIKRIEKRAKLSDAEESITAMPVREAIAQFKKLSPADQTTTRPILQKRLKAAKMLPPYLIQQVRSMGFTVK